MAELKDLIVSGQSHLIGDTVYKTHTAGDNSDKLASTAYVKNAIDAIPAGTDTKNTTGTTNKANTKLFLAGAKTQEDNPVTYSNSNVYIGTDNQLYSAGTAVKTKLTAVSDITKDSAVATAIIESITLNTNGVISPVKKSLPSISVVTSGTGNVVTSIGGSGHVVTALMGTALTSESDPVFSASAAAEITVNDIAAWNAKGDGNVTGSDLTSGKVIIGGGGASISASSGSIVTSMSGDTNIPTVGAVSQAISDAVANATHYIGGFNANTGAIDGGSETMTTRAEKRGDMYTVTTAGTFAGTALEVGDSIIFKENVAADVAVTSSDVTFVESTVSVSNDNPNLKTYGYKFNDAGTATDSTKTGNVSYKLGTIDGTNLTVNVPRVPYQFPYNNNWNQVRMSRDASLTLNMWDSRFLTISGNDITLSMLNENGGWAGTFLGLQDWTGNYSTEGDPTTVTKRTHTAFGFFGTKNSTTNKSALSYFFMGGSYSNPVAKLYPTDLGAPWSVAARFEILKSGDIVPSATNTYNCGTSSKYWKNIYTTNLNGHAVSTGVVATKASSGTTVVTGSSATATVLTGVAADGTVTLQTTDGTADVVTSVSASGSATVVTNIAETGSTQVVTSVSGSTGTISFSHNVTSEKLTLSFSPSAFVTSISSGVNTAITGVEVTGTTSCITGISSATTKVIKSTATPGTAAVLTGVKANGTATVISSLGTTTITAVGGTVTAFVKG